MDFTMTVLFDYPPAIRKVIYTTDEIFMAVQPLI
jgi:hypothetical protein